MDTPQWLDNKNIRAALLILLSLGSVFLLVKTIQSLASFDRDTKGAQEHVISVTGKGEVTATANVATFSFSVMETGATVKEAQDKASAKNNAAIKYLKDNGFADKDIKTSDYNVYPQYSFQKSVCAANVPCPEGNQVVTGYNVSQTIEVKVRDVSKAGDVLTGLGSLNVSNISGLQLTVDDQDVLARDARTKAIEDAKNQAQKLASDLGVRLGKITSFSESSGDMPRPIMYAKDSVAAGVSGQATAPALPTGENKITTYVTINFEIK